MEYSARQTQVENIRTKIRAIPEPTVPDLARYLTGKPDSLRRDIYAMYWQEATSSTNARLRSAVVELMLENVGDETAMIRGQLLKWLQDFTKGDFDQPARAALMNLPWSTEFAPAVIRLIGIAELREALPMLERAAREKTLADDATAYNDNSWAALLALARMGDAAALQRVIVRVAEEKDILVRATILFPDLAYTRQPTAFEALAGYVNSNERLPQFEPTIPGQLEAAYAAAMFARHVQGFPFSTPDPTEEQVEEARTWLESHKQFALK